MLRPRCLRRPPLPYLPCRKINMQGVTPLARVNINTPATSSRVSTGSAARSEGVGEEGGNCSSSSSSSMWLVGQVWGCYGGGVGGGVCGEKEGALEVALWDVC